MKDRVYINQVKTRNSETVKLCGFVHEVRDTKKMQFVILRDITGDIQVTVFKNEDNTNLNTLVSNLAIQSSIYVIGKVNVDDYVKLGGVEIHAESIEIVNPSASPLPLDMKGVTESNKDTRADWRFLDLRDRKRQLIFKVQTTILSAMRQYWVQRGFVELQSPKLTATPSEGGAELFGLDYFGKTAYLTQSPQVYKQMAIAAGLDKVFEIGPAFRADKSHTNRHVTEFVSVDVEMGWIDGVETVMQHQEEWLAHVIDAVHKQHAQDVRDTLGIEIVVPQVPFVRLTMTQAKQVVADAGYTVPESTKGDLDPQAERILGAWVKDRHNSDFVLVTEYPTTIRPFYHMYSDSKTSTLSFDLLYKGIEVSTGAQREHRYLEVLQQAIDKGVLKPGILVEGNVDNALMPAGMDSYFDCFRYGCPPHGGFGFGLSRFVMQLLGLDNVKEAMFLSRTVDRLRP
jgi:aspartyl-tRNA synthetase